MSNTDGDGAQQQDRVTHSWAEIAQIAALFIAFFGSLPVFALIAGPIESSFLSVLVGFGGWSVWCCILIYLTRDWPNNNA